MTLRRATGLENAYLYMGPLNQKELTQWNRPLLCIACENCGKAAGAGTSSDSVIEYIWKCIWRSMFVESLWCYKSYWILVNLLDSDHTFYVVSDGIVMASYVNAWWMYRIVGLIRLSVEWKEHFFPDFIWVK